MSSKRMSGFFKSSSFLHSKELLMSDAIFKWKSTKIYIYFAFALCNHVENFAFFSQVFFPIRLYDFILIQITVGGSYMILDIFIKLYTGKLDFNATLHPLLRGICFGILLQHALALVMFANSSSDALRYFFFSLTTPAEWEKCPKGYNNCFTSDEIRFRCKDKILTQTHMTSHYAVYRTHVLNSGGITLNTLLCITIWTLNFFLSSVSTPTILMIIKFAFYENILTTLFFCVVVMFQTKEYLHETILSILSVKLPCDHSYLVLRVCELYGIGFVGLYDFNTMSPHTLVDNAVMIFAVFIVLYLTLRSVLVDVIVKVLKTCVILDITKMKGGTQVVKFVLLPLGIQFLHAQKLLSIILFFNFIVSQTVLLALMTAIMARLLRTEFRKIKEVYISGILCFLGLCCSVTLNMFTNHALAMLRGSLYMRSLLAGLRMAIIMWFYGVNKFSTDIEFWLGFKPVKFWKYCWVIAPIPLLVTAGTNIYQMYSTSDELIMATLWILLTIVLVLFLQVKILTSFMARGNFIAAFRSSRIYGPPEEEARSLRRQYDETTQFHTCDHTCIMLDERIDCFHEYSKLYINEDDGSVTDILMRNEDSDKRMIARRRSDDIEMKSTHTD